MARREGVPRRGGKHVGSPLGTGSEQKPGWLEHGERGVWEMSRWGRQGPAGRRFEGLSI